MLVFAPCNIVRVAFNAATFVLSLVVLWYAKTHVVPPTLMKFQVLNCVAVFFSTLDKVAIASDELLYTTLGHLVSDPLGLVSGPYLLEWMTDNIFAIAMMPVPRWFNVVLRVVRVVLPGLAFIVNIFWVIYQTERFEAARRIVVAVDILLISTALALVYAHLFREIGNAMAAAQERGSRDESFLKKNRYKALAFAVFWAVAPNGVAIYSLAQYIPLIASDAPSTRETCTSLVSTILVSLLYPAITWFTFRRNFPLRKPKKTLHTATNSAATHSATAPTHSTSGSNGTITIVPKPVDS